MEIYRTICLTILLLLLGIMSLRDYHTHSIPVLPVSLTLCAGLIFQLIAQDSAWWVVLCGIIPGILLMLISILSRQAIGLGDALLIAACGAYTGMINSIVVLFAALLLAACFGLVKTAAGKSNRKTPLPFAPFILVAYDLMLLICDT